MITKPLSSWGAKPAIVAGFVLALIVLAYWPVMRAGFVWDDVTDFQKMSWLTYGDEWKHYIFKDFNFWSSYFRPLVVALFTAQVRLFNSQPAPMHVVSLCMHLIDTLLVGLLAWLSATAASRHSRQRVILLACSMLLYGLHPILIESVTWIGCQFDLMATMFMLLGLLANQLIRSKTLRAATIGLLFFLAACCKESAAAFPLILVFHDLAMSSTGDLRTGIRAFLERHWQTFVALLAAGLMYLVFRHWALGQLLQPTGSDAPSAFGRFQEVCFLYLHYWRTLFVPMPGMSPIHPIDMAPFAVATPGSLLVDILAIAMVLGALYFAVARRSVLACIVMVVTAALLPVLHIIPSGFDTSLYHERYVITGLAAACAMLPRLRPGLAADQRERTVLLASRAAAFLAVIWLAAAIVSIRTTIPMWSSNIGLWQWALTVNPESADAMNNLLSAYINRKDYRDADALLEKISATHVECAYCMLNAANMALEKNDATAASRYLEEVRTSREVAASKTLFGLYLQTTGEMLLQKNNVPDAIEVLRGAIKVAPDNSQSYILLALALARQGHSSEARSIGETGVAMQPASRRPVVQKALDDQLSQLAPQTK